MIFAHKIHDYLDSSNGYKITFSSRWKSVGLFRYALPAKPSTIKYFVNLVDCELLSFWNFIPLHRANLFHLRVSKLFWISVISFNINTGFCSVTSADKYDHFCEPYSIITALTENSWIWLSRGNHYTNEPRFITSIKAKRDNISFLRFWNFVGNRVRISNHWQGERLWQPKENIARL